MDYTIHDVRMYNLATIIAWKRLKMQIGKTSNISELGFDWLAHVVWANSIILRKQVKNSKIVHILNEFPTNSAKNINCQMYKKM